MSRLAVRPGYTSRQQIGAAVLAALLLGFFLLWQDRGRKMDRPIGSGPAGPAIAIGPFQEIWSTEKTVLLGLGDSITRGFGASEGHSFFELLLKNDDTLHPDLAGRDLEHVLPHLPAQNLAVSGTVSAEHLSDQVAKLYRQRL